MKGHVMLRQSGLCRESFLAPFLWFTGALALLGAPPAAQAGTVQAEQKISATAGGFGGDLDLGDYFGSSVAALGDLDGNGIEDLAVGATLDDDGVPGSQNGAVWILFLNADGTVASE